MVRFRTFFFFSFLFICLLFRVRKGAQAHRRGRESRGSERERGKDDLKQAPC